MEIKGIEFILSWVGAKFDVGGVEVGNQRKQKQR